MGIVHKVKGTRDFFPEDWALQTWLRDLFLDVGSLFGYREYEGPILEHQELYLGKSSEEIVTKQTFGLTDRDGRALVLRPELTPTLARMIAEREAQLLYPSRWQSFGPFFRYEKPQRGRGRAFFQWNLDLLGSDSPLADAEVITVACRMFEELGLSPQDVRIRVSDRLGMEEALVELGVARDRVPLVFRGIDRSAAAGAEATVQALVAAGFNASEAERIQDFLEVPDASFSPWLQTVLEHVTATGASAWIDVDRHIVRGFDYYTRTVFEAWATTTLRRSLFGGGRYDNLTLQVGGKRQISGVGFAVGDMALMELLAELGRLPTVTPSPTRLLVTIFSEETLPASLALARQLRDNGLSVEATLDPSQRLEKQLKYADRAGIPYVAIMGPEEIAAGGVLIKDLTKRTQQTFPLSELDELAEVLDPAEPVDDE